MTTRVHLHGEVRTTDQAAISVFDHGFLFGHSVYEVARTYQRVPFELDAHLDRLDRSAAALEIPLPDRTSFQRAIRETLAATDNPEAYIRIVVTRGTGDLNISPDSCGQPELIVFVKRWEGFPSHLYHDGLPVIVARTGRTEVIAMDPAVKSGNYANSIAALLDAQRQGARDALMLAEGGHVTEGTTSNVFVVHGNRIRTPKLDAGILAGITRATVLNLAARQGFETLEEDFDLATLLEADEAFFSSTLKEIMPITRVGEHRIGSGRPGPRTRELHEAYRAYVQEWLTGREPWW